MKTTYKIANQTDTRKIAEYLARHGEHLLPMVGLIEASRTVQPFHNVATFLDADLLTKPSHQRLQATSNSN